MMRVSLRCRNELTLAFQMMGPSISASCREALPERAGTIEPEAAAPELLKYGGFILHNKSEASCFLL